MNFQVECKCAGKPLNAGQSGCIPMVGRDKFSIFFDYKDSTGALNSIPSGTTLDQAYLVAKLNETDLSKRWWIMPEMFAVESPVPENETEDIDGIPFPTGEEIKQPALFQHVKESANPAVKAAYDSLKCRDLGMYTATYKGQLAGMNDGSGNLIGVHIQEGTLSAQWSAPVKGAVQKLMVSYLVDELENDANRDFIEAGDIAYPTKDWFANQPLEVLAHEVSNAGQVTITFTLDALYGQVYRKMPITGIVSNDISPDDGVTLATVYNETTAANVGMTIVESGAIPGQYVGTLAIAQAVSDVIKIDLSKSGYNMQSLRVKLV